MNERDLSPLVKRIMSGEWTIADIEAIERMETAERELAAERAKRCATCIFYSRTYRVCADTGDAVSDDKSCYRWQRRPEPRPADCDPRQCVGSGCTGDCP